VPLEDVPPTGHPVGKKIGRILCDNKGHCCLFGSITEVANFLWQNQEFAVGSQVVQASELIDPDHTHLQGGEKHAYETSMPLDDGGELTLSLTEGGQPSLPRGVELVVTFLSSSSFVKDTISIRMGNTIRPTLADARWTLVGVDDVKEVASVIEDVYLRSGNGTEVILPLDALKHSSCLPSAPVEVSVELNNVTFKFHVHLAVTDALGQINMITPPPFPTCMDNTPCASPEQIALEAEGMEEYHQWRLSVEIRSVKLRGTAARVFAKFNYPLLAQTKAFRTFPPVMARKNTTVHFPHAFSLYQFGCKRESEFRRAFQEMLRVEVWKRESFAADSMIGQAFFDLRPIFDQALQQDASKKTYFANKTRYNENEGFRLLDLVSSVERGDSESQGVLRAVVFLEDLGLSSQQVPYPPPGQVLQGPGQGVVGPVSAGPASRHHVPAITLSTAAAPTGTAAVPATSSTAAPNPATLSPQPHAACAPMPAPHPVSPEAQYRDTLEDMRDTPAFSCVVELELWKRNEEAKFRARLQEQERARMRQLEEEYEEKERLRSAEFHVQKSHMIKLEQQMRAKLQEVQKREAQLQTATGKLRTEKENGDRQQQACLEQASLETKLLRQELDQTLKLEYKKSKKLAAGSEALQEEVNQWRSRYKELEEQFLSFRKEVAAGVEPIENLKADVKIKQFEVTELKKKNGVIAASRDHFKTAVRALLKELEKVEREKQELKSSNGQLLDIAPANLGCYGHPLARKKNTEESKHDLEECKRSGEDGDVQDMLRQIKRDLEDLKDTERSPTPRLPHSPRGDEMNGNKNQPSSTSPSPRRESEPPVQPAIPKKMASGWTDMRKELLNSGLYNSSDRMYKYLKT